MDRAEIDVDGNGILFYGKALVAACKKIKGQSNVFSLIVNASLERKTQVADRKSVV